MTLTRISINENGIGDGEVHQQIVSTASKAQSDLLQQILASYLNYTECNLLAVGDRLERETSI